MIIDNKHNYNSDSPYRNLPNVEIYKDTLLKATQYPISKTLIVTMNEFSEEFKQDYSRKGLINVVPVDSVGALVYLHHENEKKTPKVGILNMASPKTPGGGVHIGTNAQEEALFRCSNLGLSISKSFYPLNINETLLTLDAVFFKDKTYQDLNKAYTADVITCAAPKIIDGIFPNDYENLVLMKIRTMLYAAAYAAVDVLILGAWGCGVYKNDPTFMAACFKKVLNEERGKYQFDEVLFAIINDHNSVGNNYEIFKTILDG